jgi:hypothetical protein
MMDVLRRGNLGALLLPLVLLAAGWAARARLTRKTIPYRWHGVELAHPAGWTVAERAADPTSGDSVVLTDLLGPGRIKPRVTLRITPVPAAAPDAPAADAPAGDSPGAAAPDAVVPAVAETLANKLPLYYEIGASQVQIGSIAATRIDAAFAFTPRAVPGRKGDIPVVMRSIDLVLLRGADALSVQVAAPIEDFEVQRPVLEAIVGSLRVDPAAAGTKDLEPPVGVNAAPAAAAGAEAVTVTGEVVDAESGLAVPGAIVLFLAPGTSVADVDDDNLTEIAYTTGLADSRGHFASNRALARTAHYGVMVVADGYRWIGSDDGVAIEGDTPEHLDVGAVRLRRR